MVYFAQHSRFEITNIFHCKVWDHHNTAMRVVLHRNTALKKGQNHDTAHPYVQCLPPFKYTRLSLSIEVDSLSFPFFLLLWNDVSGLSQEIS